MVLLNSLKVNLYCVMLSYTFTVEEKLIVLSCCSLPTEFILLNFGLLPVFYIPELFLYTLPLRVTCS